MEVIKILDRIEEILKEEGNRKEEQVDAGKSALRELVSLILQFVLSMVKMP